jgi:flagellar biosynthesis/type III secretory pathway protein FliH
VVKYLTTKNKVLSPNPSNNNKEREREIERRKEGRKKGGKERRREERRREGRKEGRKEGGKEGRKGEKRKKGMKKQNIKAISVVKTLKSWKHLMLARRWASHIGSMKVKISTFHKTNLCK